MHSPCTRQKLPFCSIAEQLNRLATHTIRPGSTCPPFWWCVNVVACTVICSSDTQNYKAYICQHCHSHHFKNYLCMQCCLIYSQHACRACCEHREECVVLVMRIASCLFQHGQWRSSIHVLLACTSLVFRALDLHQSQEQLQEKVTCPPKSTMWRRPWTRVVRVMPFCPTTRYVRFVTSSPEFSLIPMRKRFTIQCWFRE